MGLDTGPTAAFEFQREAGRGGAWRALADSHQGPACPSPRSAADIYIQEHFHGYVSSGHPEAAPLRVMYTDRPPSQTDAATLQYCCLSEDRRAFRPPTRAELERHRIVVATTSQARELRVPAGFFSHILIDEAAQMLECEALTPLRYARPGTRVVLAGDHMQVTPRLFSAAQAAEHTLLHRLFRHYQQQQHAVARQSRVIFHENYRSTEAIVAFVSRHFYVAKGDPIHASGQVPRHPRRYPLMFCHVAGSPERDMSMTSWLNTAEAMQVVEQVQEVYDTWPRCWGSREQRHICVVSHGAQVSPAAAGLLRGAPRRGLPRGLGDSASSAGPPPPAWPRESSPGRRHEPRARHGAGGRAGAPCAQRPAGRLALCSQVGVLRQELRKKNLGQVSVGSFEILPGGWPGAGQGGPGLPLPAAGPDADR